MERGSEKLDGERIEQVLKKVETREPGATALFASRCALRVFPLLVGKPLIDLMLAGRVKVANTGKVVSVSQWAESVVIPIWDVLVLIWCHHYYLSSPNAVGYNYFGALRKCIAKLPSVEMRELASDDALFSMDFVSCSIASAVAASNFDPLESANSAVDADAYARSMCQIRSIGEAIGYPHNNDHGDTVLSVIHDLERLDGGEGNVFLAKKSLWVDGAVPPWFGIFRHVEGLLAFSYYLHGVSGQNVSMRYKKINFNYRRLVTGHVNVDDLLQGIGSFDRDSADGYIGNEIESKLYYPSHRLHSEGLLGNDCLNRDQLARELAKLISVPDFNLHLTVGLLGDWGSGKSFLIDLLCKRLPKARPHFLAWCMQRYRQRKRKDRLSFSNWRQKHPPVRYFTTCFNAWAYEHSANIQAGVAQESVRGLTRDLDLPGKAWLTWRFAWKQHRWRILWLLVFVAVLVIVVLQLRGFGQNGLGVDDGLLGLLGVGSLIGVWKLFKEVFAHPLANELRTYLQLPTYGKHLGTIPVMREQLNALCKLRLGYKKRWGLWGKAYQNRLLFVVDDLDRCSPAGIVKTLEAVRLVLDIPQVNVIIAVDHRIALAALAHHYRELAEYHQDRPPLAIARDYLAKVIHLPIRLTEADPDAVKGYLIEGIWGGDYPSEIVEAGEGGASNEELPESLENIINEDIGDVEKGQEQPSVNPETSKPKKAENLEPSDESLENEPPPAIEGMNPNQKKAFVYWIHHFGMHNPRQVKRLYNSYKLIRLYHGEEGVIEFDNEDNHLQAFAYPRMVGLLFLEHMNEQDNKTRRQIQQALKGDDIEPNPLGQKPWKLPYSVLQQANHWRAETEPFVLPACDDGFGVSNDPIP